MKNHTWIAFENDPTFCFRNFLFRKQLFETFCFEIIQHGNRLREKISKKIKTACCKNQQKIEKMKISHIG